MYLYILIYFISDGVKFKDILFQGDIWQSCCMYYKFNYLYN